MLTSTAALCPRHTLVFKSDVEDALGEKGVGEDAAGIASPDVAFGVPPVDLVLALSVVCFVGSTRLLLQHPIFSLRPLSTEREKMCGPFVVVGGGRGQSAD